MRNIIVNIFNDTYQRVTNYKGKIGIGKPYADNGATEIIVSSTTIANKLTRLQTLKQELSREPFISRANGGPTQPSADNLSRRFPGESVNSGANILFKEKLRDILYPPSEGVPPEVVGTLVRTFFPYSVTGFTANQFNQVVQQCKQLTDNWINLFTQISQLQEGLATLAEESEEDTEFDGIVLGNTQIDVLVGGVQINLIATPVPLSTALYSASVAVINLKTVQFFDEDREYKTVLNFGSDEQYLVQSWRPVTSDSSSIQLKLFNPLNSNIDLYKTAYIGREIANSVVDNITIELPVEPDNTPFLRPKNTNVGKFASNQQIVRDATLDSLGITTGSIGYVSGSILTYDDRAFNRWYTADFNSSELNIDFTNYNNFVQYSSATKRLDAFKQKLTKIETLGTRASLSSSNVGERNRAIEREYIKRNFDAYEQFLYFATQSYAYSASVYYTDSEYEYHATASWPKQPDGIPYSVTSSIATSWYTTQYGIAERYDEYNQNYLVRSLPAHIQEDSESSDFTTFVAMFGHIMDNVKLYIDQFPYIYSTNPDPYKELTLDQVYEVVQSFGFELPNAYSIEQLQSFISTVYDKDGSRGLVAETWKRFLHSAMYMAKSKGSRTSIDAMMNIYGINSPIIQLKEAAYPTTDSYVKSDELTYGIRFVSASANRIRVPFVSSSVSASTLQIRFIPSLVASSSLLSGDDKWAVDIVPHPSTSTVSVTYNTANGPVYRNITNPAFTGYGRINIVSGSSRTLIATSSYFKMFDDDYTLLTLRSQSGDFYVVQSDGDQILHQYSASTNLPSSIWNRTTHIHVGASGSIKQGSFDGVVDEIRVWGEQTSQDNIIKQAYDPGAYFGSSYSSSYENLYVDVSFSQPYASITQSATNETVYKSASFVANLPATGFTTASYERLLRTIRQYTPVVGSTVYSTKKVHVASPPTFGENFKNDDGSYQLKRFTSIKPTSDKKYTAGQQFVSFTVSPSDFINQNIMRSMGKNINTNYLIGSPAKLKGERYIEIDSIYNFYLKNYNDTINGSKFIRFYSNLLKAPAEYSEKLIPARAKLLKGVSIESPILDRKRTVMQRAFNVTGTGTKQFIDFISGSGSSYNMGAYSFDANYQLPLNTDYSLITRPIIQRIGTSLVTGSLLSNNSAYTLLTAIVDAETIPQSSTPVEELPPGRKYTQYIGNAWVSSSVGDNKSSVDFVDATIEGLVGYGIIESSSGYPRNPYLGITDRIATEDDTLSPFYQIEPISDFSDVGTTTYFHKSNGIYSLPSVLLSNTNELYRTKLDISGEVASPFSYYYANITLLATSSLADAPGRATTNIKLRTYTSGSSYTGILRIANIFSLFGLAGTAGLRFRLYNNQSSQLNDITRDFNTVPTASAGVLFDAILDGTPNLFPYTLIQTDANSLLYFTVDNTTSSPITSTIVMSYFEYQPADAVPHGYLPRHYRFTRSTLIAQQRRNYLGCRIVYCPDGCPPDTTPTDTISPVQIEFVGDSDTATVDNPLKGRFDRGGPSPFSPTERNTPGRLPNNDVFKFGGGGQLK